MREHYIYLIKMKMTHFISMYTSPMMIVHGYTINESIRIIKIMTAQMILEMSII